MFILSKKRDYNTNINVGFVQREITQYMYEFWFCLKGDNIIQIWMLVFVQREIIKYERCFCPKGDHILHSHKNVVFCPKGDNTIQIWMLFFVQREIIYYTVIRMLLFVQREIIQYKYECCFLSKGRWYNTNMNVVFVQREIIQIWMLVLCKDLNESAADTQVVNVCRIIHVLFFIAVRLPCNLMYRQTTTLFCATDYFVWRDGWS